MAKSWYVVHAYSGYEKQVMRSLAEQVSFKGLEDKFGDILVPTEEVVEMRDGKKRKSERKFYPGYVLVQMDMDDDAWHLVKSTPRVLGFIGGTADKPIPITAGEVVRVIDGPFADFNGVVEEVDYDKSRVKVAVLIFGRSTPVELEFGQVEKD